MPLHERLHPQEKIPMRQLTLTESSRKKVEENFSLFNRSERMVLEALLANAPQAVGISNTPSDNVKLSKIRKKMSEAVTLRQLKIYKTVGLEGVSCLAESLPKGVAVSLPLHSESLKLPQNNHFEDLFLCGILKENLILPLLTNIERELLAMILNEESWSVQYERLVPLFLQEESGSYSLKSLVKNLASRFFVLNNKLKKIGSKPVLFSRCNGKVRIVKPIEIKTKLG